MLGSDQREKIPLSYLIQNIYPSSFNITVAGKQKEKNPSENEKSPSSFGEADRVRSDSHTVKSCLARCFLLCPLGSISPGFLGICVWQEWIHRGPARASPLRAELQPLPAEYPSWEQLGAASWQKELCIPVKKGPFGVHWMLPSVRHYSSFFKKIHINFDQKCIVPKVQGVYKRPQILTPQRQSFWII